MKQLSLVLLCVSLSVMSKVAFANVKACTTHYSQKRFLQAGQCFYNVAKGISAKNSPKQLYAKRAYLLNADRAYRKAEEQAINKNQFDKLPYLREQALKSAELLIQQPGLPAVTLQRATNRKNALNQLIGYGILRIEVSTKANICVAGFKYKRCETTKKWEQAIRPGRYDIRVLLPSAKKPMTRKISMAPRGQVNERFVIAGPTPRPTSEKSTFVLRTTPTEADVYVDGKHRGRTPLTVRVVKGPHKIVLTKPCYVKTQQTILLRAGQTENTHLVLKSTKAYQAWLLRGKSASSMRLIGWILLGTGAALAVAGGIGFGVGAASHGTATDIQNAVDAGKIQPSTAAQTQFRESATAGNIAVGIGYVGVFGGVASMAAGLALAFGPGKTPGKPSCPGVDSIERGK